MDKNQIAFSIVDVGGHSDERRDIVDFHLLGGIVIPFLIGQVKIITFKVDAVLNNLPVGNHYHTRESDRQEFFVAMGMKGVELFRFRWRNEGSHEVQERPMGYGDACYVPPGVSHSFIPRRECALWGLSNLPYNAAHDITDKLF